MGVDVLDDKPGSGRLRRRRIILLVVVGLAVIASIGGLLISTTIKSPAQQAAETKAPGLTRLTAPVQDTDRHRSRPFQPASGDCGTAASSRHQTRSGRLCF